MIDSLLAQTYSNWELCIANGSPEDKKMQAVLDEYANKDSRIRVKYWIRIWELQEIQMQHLR